ncbi:MAG: hypothetical protein EA385_05180 [Salinarimonadaceae bacterium]|nr:MAG: hypothetical protein EA385_05180 [Salinarimonadaceae bacterium]
MTRLTRPPEGAGRACNAPKTADPPLLGTDEFGEFCGRHRAREGVARAEIVDLDAQLLHGSDIAHDFGVVVEKDRLDQLEGEGGAPTR